ncbi:HTTM domain-containing protein [Kineococcus sp. G2]|uniref:HTTM domain-containing protein n=1 Tax=Kineococcus sp. G2 TaxID=3127484 RepID=UPI00301E60E6
MSGAWGAFDRWVARGPFTATDLGRYRVLFAVLLLLTPSRFTWVAPFPDSFVKGPPGPFMLLRAVPPREVLVALDLLVLLAAGFLLLGLFTRTASVVVGLTLLTGNGISYSFGKIDHSIFLVLVPLVLVFARWGDAVSVDALRRRYRQDAPATGPAPAPPQWPLRLLALLVGLGFLTAAAPKLLSGWLSPATQAVQGVMHTQYHVNGRTEFLAGTFLDVRSVLFWESVDVATVLLEGLLVLAVLNWRAWRIGIAVATLFHFGVLLMMNIGFAANVFTDAAFVAWGSLRLPAVRALPRRWLARYGWAVAVAVGAFAAFRPEEWVVPRQGQLIVLLGALVSAWYLLRQARALLRRGRPGSRAPQPVHDEAAAAR